jgi:hypothetical protein
MYSVAGSAIACQRAIMRLEKIIIVMLCLTGFHVLVQGILVFLSGSCIIFTSYSLIIAEWSLQLLLQYHKIYVLNSVANPEPEPVGSRPF